MAVLNPRSVATEQPGKALNIALREILGFAQFAKFLSNDHSVRLHHACLAQQGTAAYDSANMCDALHYLGTIGVLFLLLGASVAIWKWAERYMTNMVRVPSLLVKFVGPIPDSLFQFIEAGVQLAEQRLPFFYAQKRRELRTRAVCRWCRHIVLRGSFQTREAVTHRC